MRKLTTKTPRQGLVRRTLLLSSSGKCAPGNSNKNQRRNSYNIIEFFYRVGLVPIGQEPARPRFQIQAALISREVAVAMGAKIYVPIHRPGELDAFL